MGSKRTQKGKQEEKGRNMTSFCSFRFIINRCKEALIKQKILKFIFSHFKVNLCSHTLCQLQQDTVPFFSITTIQREAYFLPAFWAALVTLPAVFSDLT